MIRFLFEDYLFRDRPFFDTVYDELLAAHAPFNVNNAPPIPTENQCKNQASVR